MFPLRERRTRAEHTARSLMNYLPGFAGSQQQVSMSLFASVQWSFPFLPVSQQQEAMVFPVRVQRSAPSPLALVVTPRAAIATSVIAMRFMVLSLGKRLISLLWRIKLRGVMGSRLH